MKSKCKGMPRYFFFASVLHGYRMCVQPDLILSSTGLVTKIRGASELKDRTEQNKWKGPTTLPSPNLTSSGLAKS